MALHAAALTVLAEQHAPQVAVAARFGEDDVVRGDGDVPHGTLDRIAQEATAGAVSSLIASTASLQVNTA